EGLALIVALVVTATATIRISAIHEQSGMTSTPTAARVGVAATSVGAEQLESERPAEGAVQHTAAAVPVLLHETPSTAAASPSAAPAPHSATCTVWSLPPHDQPPFSGGTIVGQPVAVANPVPMTPSTELVKETMSLNGATLVMRIYVTDLDEQFQTGADGLSWRTTWSYAGTDYSAWATYLQGGSESFSVATGAFGQPYQLQTQVTGTVVTGTDGYAEIDVPLRVAGDPGLGSVMTAVTGTSFADFGAGPAPNMVEWNVDSGGGRSAYTVGDC